MYYWLDLGRLAAARVPTREPGFLENPRTPKALTASAARLRLWSTAPLAAKATAAAAAAASASAASSAAASSSADDASLPAAVEEPGARLAEVHVAGTVGPTELMSALRGPAAEARVLRVHSLLHHLPFLAAAEEGGRASAHRPGGGRPGGKATTSAVDFVDLPSGKATLAQAAAAAAMSADLRAWMSHAELTALTKGFWCTACPITRRGAVVHEHNRSVVRELEAFCKTEARAKLGLGPPMQSCCSRGGACHTCRPWEKQVVRNASRLPWAMQVWLPAFAKLELPPRQRGDRPGGAWPVCTHPLCTGSDRQRFP